MFKIVSYILLSTVPINYEIKFKLFQICFICLVAFVIAEPIDKAALQKLAAGSNENKDSAHQLTPQSENVSENDKQNGMIIIIPSEPANQGNKPGDGSRAVRQVYPTVVKHL